MNVSAEALTIGRILMRPDLDDWPFFTRENVYKLVQSNEIQIHD
jgi:hypothetical protein